MLTKNDGINVILKKAELSSSLFYSNSDEYVKKIEPVIYKVNVDNNHATVKAESSLVYSKISGGLFDVNMDGILSELDLAAMHYLLTDKVYGDINGDGVFNQEDKNLANEYRDNTDSLTNVQKIVVDVNKDGSISDADINLIVSSSSFEGVSFKYGDVNYDGVIDQNDYYEVDNYLRGGSVHLGDVQIILADMNIDGIITYADLSVIRVLLNNIYSGDPSNKSTVFEYCDMVSETDGVVTEEKCYSEKRIGLVAAIESNSNLLDHNKDGIIDEEDLIKLSKEINLLFCFTTSKSSNNCKWDNKGIFYNKISNTYYLHVKNQAGLLSSSKIVISDSTDNVSPIIESVTSACDSKDRAIIKIVATDNNKLADKAYSIDGVKFQSGNKFTVTKNKDYTIFVKDNFSNITTKTFTVSCITNRDTEAPQVEIKTTCNSKKTEATVTLKATDNVSLASSPYKLKSGIAQKSNVFNLKQNGTYTFYTTDTSGNITKNLVTISCIVDKIKPKISDIEVKNDKSNGFATITVTATDNIGLNTNKPYGIYNSKQLISYYQNSNIFKVAFNGYYTIFVKDANGNKIKQTVKVSGLEDKTPPTIKINTTCNSVLNTANLVIKATDNEKLATKAYSIDGINYQRSNIFKIKENKQLKVYVKDSSDNVAIKDVTITCLKGKDLIYPKATIKATCSQDKKSADIVITASDNVALADLPYSINNKDYQKSNIVTVNKNKTYIIYIKDSSGNITKKRATITCIR